MKMKMNLTAIIAVAMVAMSVLVLGSCNADDDYNEFDYGTLAKGLATRSGETPQPNYRKIESFGKTVVRHIESTDSKIAYSGNVEFGLVIYKIVKINDSKDYHYEAEVSCNEEKFNLSLSEVLPASARIHVAMKNPEYTVDAVSVPEYIEIYDFCINESSY